MKKKHKRKTDHTLKIVELTIQAIIAIAALIAALK